MLWLYADADKEFGEALMGSIIIMKKALNGLERTSSRHWYAHFSDSLCGGASDSLQLDMATTFGSGSMKMEIAMTSTFAHMLMI